MNIITRPDKLRGIEGRIGIEKISRRSVLKGLGIAGGLVLPAPVTSRQAFAAYQTGAGKMPHGTVVDPRVFVAISSHGTVTIQAHRAALRDLRPDAQRQPYVAALDGLERRRGGRSADAPGI